MKRLPIIRGMIRRHRRARIAQLLEQVQSWEAQGLDLFAQLEDLTEPDDDLGLEVRRCLRLLSE